MSDDEIKQIVDEVRKSPGIAEDEAAYSGKKATTRVSGSFSAFSASAIGYALGVSGVSIAANAAETKLVGLLAVASGASAVSVASTNVLQVNKKEVSSLKQGLSAVFVSLVSKGSWCAAFKKPVFGLKISLSRMRMAW